MTPEALENASSLSYEQPLWGNHFTLDNQIFCILSRKALKEIRENGSCTFNGTTWNSAAPFGMTQQTFDGKPVLNLIDPREGAEMWVLDDEELPLIIKMQNNPVEIDWEVK